MPAQQVARIIAANRDRPCAGLPERQLVHDDAAGQPNDRKRQRQGEEGAAHQAAFLRAAYQAVARCQPSASATSSSPPITSPPPVEASDPNSST